MITFIFIYFIIIILLLLKSGEAGARAVVEHACPAAVEGWVRGGG
jgi:hypothetical protein